MQATRFSLVRSAAVLPLLLVGVSCTGSNPGTGPTPTFSLVLEKVGFGVVAAPAQNTSYAPGTVVNYAFSAQDGSSRVYVTLDGAVVPASGAVTINQNRVFTAVIDNQVGSPAPNFTARTSAGVMVRLSDYLGKIVLVDFSEPTCVGSPPEAVALKTHYGTYHSRGLEIVTVLVNCPGLNNCPTNSPTSASNLDSWQLTFSLPYPVISDLAGATAIYNWSIPEKTTDFPTTYIVSPAGMIQYRFRGFDGPAISAALAALFP